MTCLILMETGKRGLAEREGTCTEAGEPKQFSWFTLRAGVGSGQGPWLHTGADPAVPRA